METVYVGNSLVNDVFLGYERMNDVLTKNVTTINSIRTDAFSASLSLAIPGYLFPSPSGFAQTTYRSDISSYIRGTGASYSDLAVSGSGTYYMSASNAFTSDGYNGSIFVNGAQNQGAVASSDTNFSLTGGVFTIETYFNEQLSSGLNRNIIYCLNGTAGYDLQVQTNNTFRWITRGTAYDSSPASTININNWYHLALTATANGDTAIFFNGSRVFSGNISAPNAANIAIQFLGRSDDATSDGFLFNDFRVYKGISKYSPLSSSITPPPSMIYNTYQ
jgi:hypothetical protein